MKNNYLVFFKSGKINIYEEINETLKHLIKEDVILYIYDIKKNVTISRDQNGSVIETKMTVINLK